MNAAFEQLLAPTGKNTAFSVYKDTIQFELEVISLS